MKQATMIAAAAAIKTAPAAISFICRTTGCLSRVIKSIVFSIAVLNNSATSTSAITMIKAIHSLLRIFKKIPDAMAIIASDKWIHILCSLRNTCLMPDHAYTKLFSRAATENFLFIPGYLLKSTLTLPLNFAGEIHDDRQGDEQSDATDQQSIILQLQNGEHIRVNKQQHH